jgi:predicted GH43/DUF377 family glycosyl hydrolase
MKLMSILLSFPLFLTADLIYEDYLPLEEETVAEEEPFPSSGEDFPPSEQTLFPSDEEELTNLADAYNPALADLEQMAQDFVLKTKQIELAGYAGAFNPSIIRWDGSLLLSFRVRDPITKRTDGIGLVKLDEEFNPIAEPQILSICYEEPKAISKQQDPRLVQVGSRLFLVYNNVLDHIAYPELRRMYYMELLYDGSSFYPQRPQIIAQYPYQLSYRQEKNWVPFDYNDQLLLGYMITPHSIFRPLEESHTCELFAETKGEIQWPWGVLRGGTPALKVDGMYLAFFHSSISLPSLHSQGKNIFHYFMGAYTFSLTPPFQITQISPHPIIGKTFYTSPAYKTWKPLRVVFPGGYVFDDHFIWIVYGKQDFEMWVVQLDKKKLFESLIPVTQ